MAFAISALHTTTELKQSIVGICAYEKQGLVDVRREEVERTVWGGGLPTKGLVDSVKETQRLKLGSLGK